MARPIVGGSATYDDLRRVPAHLVAEIIGGELFATPRPATPHAYVTSRLTAEIDMPFVRGRGGPGGWWILVEPELHFGNDVVVPDVAGWRHARMPVIPDAPYLSTPPDWVCEVLSPSTERLDRVRKLAVYGRENVDFIWLINPETRTLEVLRSAAGGWALVATYADTDLVRAQPFDAIELELASLWLPREPPAIS
jgi:Uma2 family endonuclease